MISIGDLVARTGVNARSIRYYEEIGLLDDVARTPGGQRRYAQEDVERLLTIRRLRALGLPFEEVKALLDLDDGRLEPDRARAEADAFARAIEARIDRLTALCAELTRRGPEVLPAGTLSRVLASFDDDLPG